MAGGGSAYTRLEKPDNSISQGLQFWGQQAAQERENDKLRKEREQIRQDEKEKEFDKNFGSLDEFRTKVTGFDTYDQIGADYTTKVRDEYVKEYNRASEALRTGNVQERKDAEMRMRTLKGTFAQIGDINTTLAKLNEDYVKMAQEGKISGVDADNWEAQMEAIIKDKNFTIELDKNGSPMIVGLQKDSNDPLMVDDGKGGLKRFEVKYSDIVNGNWRPYMRQDITGKNGLVAQYLDNLGSYEEIKEKGLVITKSQLWNEKVESGARAQIQTVLGNDETLADILNQINGNKKKTGFTDEERKIAEDNLLEAIRGGYKEKYSEEFNKDKAAYQLGTAKLAEEKRKNRANEAIARKNAATAAKVAETGRINALTNKKKIEHEISKEDEIGKGIVTISEPFKDGNSTYRTFNISNKDEKGKESLLPFIAYVDAEGKPVNISSVDIDTKTGNMRYKDGKGKIKTISAEKDYNLYNTIWNQIEGREERNSSNRGVSSGNQKTAEELMQEYGF